MYIDPNLCPYCGEGKLIERQRDRESEIDGYKFLIRGLLHAVCDSCHESVTTPSQSRHNKRVSTEARAKAVEERDRAQQLTPCDILRIRKKLGLTQAQAARVFGGGANAFSKYENGEVTPSDGMERLLRLADSVPAAASWLMRRAGVPPELAHDHMRETKQALLSALKQIMQDPHSHTGFRTSSLAKVVGSLQQPRQPGVTFTYGSKAAMAANDSKARPRQVLAAVG